MTPSNTTLASFRLVVLYYSNHSNYLYLGVLHYAYRFLRAGPTTLFRLYNEFIMRNVMYGDVQAGESVLQQHRYNARTTAGTTKNCDPRQRLGLSPCLPLCMLVCLPAFVCRPMCLVDRH